MRKTADDVSAGKTGLINGVVVGQRGLSREGPLYNFQQELAVWYHMWMCET